jgi:signal transduction histidine kinase
MNARATRLNDHDEHGGRWMSALHQLASALFEARYDVARVFEALATCLTANLCDGCAIMLLPGTVAMPPVMHHRTRCCDELAEAIDAITDPVVHELKNSDEARRTLPAGYHAYIECFGLRGLAILPLAGGTKLRGLVIATRDRGSRPFDDDDLAAIETCIEYASFAAETAHELDAERAALAAERERTSRFMHEMVGIVGHDLRGPLAAILMSTEILSTGDKNAPSSAHAVTRIVSFGKRMTRMVDQLLDLARARLGGGIAVARTRTRLVPLIKNVIDELSAAHPGCRFDLDAAGDLTGIWDADRIAQMLLNVLGNAVKFGLAGAPINVGASHADGVTTITVHNEVSDEPIAPAALVTLFEPYHRSWDRDRNGAGLGVGLYIAHEIVRAHRGTIAAESSAAGTTFRIVLPDVVSS